MQNITLRDAMMDDVPSVLSLLESLGYKASEDELKIRVQKFNQSPGYGIVVACLENKVVGWIAWSKSDLFVLNKTRFHIEGLVVDEHCRGFGIGRKLMAHVEEMARVVGPSIVDLTSGLRRVGDGSHEFYQSLGYQNEGPMAKLYLRKEV